MTTQPHTAQPETPQSEQPETPQSEQPETPQSEQPETPQSESTQPDTPQPGGERADLLQTLATHRHFLTFTVRDLTDEQAALRTTVSALCLGGLIKHVANVEEAWAEFIVNGPEALDINPESGAGSHLASFEMLPGETLRGLLDHYAEIAQATDRLVETLPDLDASQPLPAAPWFEPGARWSARRVLLHVIAETAQHAGHADIIRESLDGAKTMG